MKDIQNIKQPLNVALYARGFYRKTRRETIESQLDEVKENHRRRNVLYRISSLMMVE